MTDNDCRDPKDARIRKLEARQKDMIHKADLRELIEQWRTHTYKDEEFYRGMEACADDLERVVERDG